MEMASWWTTPASFVLQERIFLTLSNYIFTAVFLAEMTVKVKGEWMLVWALWFLMGVWTVELAEGGRFGCSRELGWGLQGGWLVTVTQRWSPGGGSGLVLRGAGIPAQQLERARRAAGAHLSH